MMGDEHCSINERCDLWALGRSQDRVNQSPCNDVCNGSGDLSVAHSSTARHGCNFQTCVGYTKTGVSICPPIDADSIHCSRKRHRARHFFFRWLCRAAASCTFGAKKKKIASSKRQQNASSFFFRNINKVFACNVYIHVHM